MNIETLNHTNMKRKSIMWMLSGLCMLSMVSLIGCTKDDHVISRDIEVCVADANGNDLLDPTSTKANVIKEMKFYDIYKGDTTRLEYYDQSDHFVKEYSEYDDPYPEKHYAVVYGKFRNNEKQSTLLIEWSNGTKDMMTIEYEKESHNTYYEMVKKIYLNGTEVWGDGINPYKRALVLIMK
jgi:hypothetical protein